MWCLAMRYKLTRQTVVVWINHAQTIVWFVGLGCKSKMWLIPTLSVVPNYIPSNIKEDNLRVQTFRVLYASGTAAPHTSPVGICVSWRPTQRPCDVIWMMCYHLSILLDNPCCSKRWQASESWNAMSLRSRWRLCSHCCDTSASLMTSLVDSICIDWMEAVVTK